MPGMIQPERELEWDEDGYLARARIKSFFTGQWNVMTVNHAQRHRSVTKDQYQRWQDGEHIQNAMPQLNDDEREFLLSGATPDEWNAMMKEDD